MVRQWVEFYVARIRSETPWDAISSDQLKSVLEVRIGDIPHGSIGSVFIYVFIYLHRS